MLGVAIETGPQFEREILTLLNRNKRSELHELFDSYIDSGRRRDGADAVFERRIPRRAAALIHYFFENTKPLGGKWVHFSRARHRRRIAIGNYGEVSVPEIMRGLSLDLAQNTARELGGRPSPRYELSRIVAGVMCSDLKFRLARCRYAPCGRYFLTSGDRTTLVFHEGTFHTTACMKNRRTAARMKKRRDKANNDVADWIADVLRGSKKYGAWRDDAGIRSRLASVVSPRVVEEQGRTISGNWIAHHKQLVEAALH